MMRPNDFNLYAHYRACFPADLRTTLLTDHEGVCYRYEDAEMQSAKLANYLCSLGLRSGDRVSVQVNKSVEVLWLYLACLRAGLVFHPLNTAYQSDELKYFIHDAEPALLVCDGADQQSIKELTDSAGVAHLRVLNDDRTGSLLEESAGCSTEFETRSSSANSLAALLYSSGTTGRPKGIMLSHRNLLDNARTLVAAWGFSRADCLLHVLPIFHVHGLFVAIGCVLISGASMHWLPKFSAASAISGLGRSTVMMGVPTYYTRLLAEPGFNSEVCSHMRLFVSGSAPLLAETFKEFEARTGHVILERYGMTETGMNTSNPLDGERRAGTVGFPLAGVEVRIVGELDRPVDVGEVGDLQVRGSNVFQGYWKMPEKTAEDFTADGFFRTGDKAVIDVDGYVSIVGRAKDMVITGGLNVYPKEIELLLDSLPGVAESAVIGLPDTDFGEAVAAVIVSNGEADLDEGRVIAAVKARLAVFKAPKRVFFIDILPRNAMGKVQKNLLRARYS